METSVRIVGNDRLPPSILRGMKDRIRNTEIKAAAHMLAYINEQRSLDEKVHRETYEKVEDAATNPSCAKQVAQQEPSCLLNATSRKLDFATSFLISTCAMDSVDKLTIYCKEDAGSVHPPPFLSL